MITLQNILFLP